MQCVTGGSSLPKQASYNVFAEFLIANSPAIFRMFLYFFSLQLWTFKAAIWWCVCREQCLNFAVL
ncbi:uncharacterized protein BDV14DRAFT_176799 [Aspergillus stella-maris]|uniref:uncharacterized protein n=1 Tax=Aspergillus stella-maris TaxID=1810926 RepID=UPI003CCDD816